MLYFAYGSNLNIARMQRRCPAATPLGKFRVTDARLVFRGVADCVYDAGGVCHGGLWLITERCEEALDLYEGVDAGMYRKEMLDLSEPVEGYGQLMLYAMNSTGIMPPGQGYLDVIREGYRDFRLPMKALDDAVRASWDDRHPSHLERRRYMRTGRPALAPRPPSRQQSRQENRHAGTGKPPAKSGD